MFITITEFIRPNGRTKDHTQIIDDKHAYLWHIIRNHGLRFTIEQIPTDLASICLEHEEGDYIQELMPIPEVVKKGLQNIMIEMMLKFKVEEFEEWLKNMRE